MSVLNKRNLLQFFSFLILLLLGIFSVLHLEPGPAFLDVLSLILFVLSPLGGLYFIFLTWIKPQAKLRKALFLSLLFSFCLLLWLYCVMQNLWFFRNPGKIINTFASYLISGNYGVGLTLSMIHGLSPIFIFYGILHSSKKMESPLLDPNLKKTPFIITMYFLPLALFLLIFIASLGNIFLDMQQGQFSFEESLFNHLHFFSGTIICVSSFVSFFYLPASILFLKRTHKSGLKEVIEIRKLVKSALIPLMILIPAANLIVLLLPNFQWQQLPSKESLEFLLRFVSAPLLCIVALALSLMKRRKRIGYWILIILAGLFSLINLSLLSLFLGFLIIYYSGQEMIKIHQ